jgi:diguanylate cyclase (GGDEF)-like protein
LEVSLATTVVGEKPIFVAMVRDISERVVADEKLFAMATQDSLTGVRNRRYFLEGLESEVARCRRHGRPLSLLSLDADYFKAVNDTFGHEAGDRVLRRIADTCRGNLREVDLVGRMGGEEFAIAMPDTDLETARMAAERLRLMVAAERIDYDDQTLQVTMSVGISALRDNGLDFSVEHCIEDLMRRSDKALYQAKKAGRNRVVVDIVTNESVSNALGG